MPDGGSLVPVFLNHVFLNHCFGNLDVTLFTMFITHKNALIIVYFQSESCSCVFLTDVSPTEFVILRYTGLDFTSAFA
jgi:hypothetical protein